MAADTLPPLYQRIAQVAAVTGDSQWVVRNKIRTGRYRALKSGRSVLVDMGSVREDLAKLPPAAYAPLPRRNKSGAGLQDKRNL